MARHTDLPGTPVRRRPVRHDGGVPDYTELRLADGTAVRFELAPGGAVAVPAQARPDDPPGKPADLAGGRGDLPEGMGDAVPVGLSLIHI